MTMKLLVIILNYKVTHLTIECLRALKPEIAQIEGARAIVCENGTGPAAVRELRAAIASEGWANWVELREVFPNLGFTGGNNIVIREALQWSRRPEYVLLLNADAFVRPGVLRAIVDFMDVHPRAGVVGPRIENLDGSHQCSPFRQLTFLSELNRGFRWGLLTRILSPWTATPSNIDSPIRADWVSGACMCIRRQVIDEIGPLDEGLYTYFDDPDYCLNARRSGWAVWYVPAGRVGHLGGQSTGVTQPAVRPTRLPTYWFLARRRYFLKNFGPVHALLADVAFLVGCATWRFRRMLQRKPDNDPPRLLWDSFRHSVFCTGFTVSQVPNPALERGRAEASPPVAPQQG